MEKFGFARGYAQTSYERLILTQPDIEFGGLWNLNSGYYVVCREVEGALSSDGTPLKEWFDEHCRIIAYPVDLVAVPPEGAVRVPARTPAQLSQLNGAPLNISELKIELRRQLPKDFPIFKIEDRPDLIRVVTPIELGSELQQLVGIAIANLGVDIDLQFDVQLDQFPQVSAPEFYFSDQRLKGWPQKLIAAQEAGEQQWFDDRLSLFSSEQTDSSRYIPMRSSGQAACFLDCSFGMPGNIRNYLTSYSVIYLAPPFGKLDDLFGSLCVSERELVWLINSGRVVIVLPAELHHYERDVLARLIDLDRCQVVLNKQLAAASIAEGRKRNPLLYPVLDNESRRSLLDMLSSESVRSGVGDFESVRRYFGSSWASLETDFSTLGARAALHHGAGRLLAELISSRVGQDINPVILACSASVEWGTALNANYCPVSSKWFDVEPIAKLTASFISGVPARPIIDTASNLGVVVEDLLVLDGNLPVEDVLDAFRPEDINRLNGLLEKHNFDASAVKDYVENVNGKIRRLERVERNFKRRDLLTLAGALVPALVAGPAATWVPVAVWFMQRMLDNESREGNAVTDWLRAKNAFTTTDTVFVSRLRKQF
ncbi:hypothetical protein [Pseudomonas kermanshahensis]|jgi:hypothetical protein|uniref:hypothetical protein n=1 Tax=Pseudomonas kermanshahensis TaxID=2745482 RepID=UPI0020938E9A|nr:hypothetical protein [Pseudomonas kermanshahensis]USS56768.1 hypothetical protein NG836_07695 [Pseudomonas kermanshahensis]